MGFFYVITMGNHSRFDGDHRPTRLNRPHYLRLLAAAIGVVIRHRVNEEGLSGDKKHRPTNQNLIIEGEKVGTHLTCSLLEYETRMVPCELFNDNIRI